MIESGHAGADGRRGGAQARHSRLVHLPAGAGGLQDCRPANLLGEAGKGHHIAFNVLNVGRFKLGVACVGGARHALGHMIRYAKERKAFGKAIAEFGLIQRKISASATQLYAAESMAYRTAGMIDAGLEALGRSRQHQPREIQKRIEEYAVECSILKVYGSEMLTSGGRRADCHHGWLRLRRGVSGGAALSRCAHQPDL